MRCPQGLLLAQGFISGNRHFLVSSPALLAQARLLHPQLPLPQTDGAFFPSVPADLATFLARMPGPGHALRRQLQHRFHVRSPQHVNQFVDGQPRLLNQLHQRQQRLPVLRQVAGPILGVVLVYDVVGFLHDDSPFL